VQRDYEFRWIEWNIGHIDAHNLSVGEVEYVIRRNTTRYRGDGRYIARGKTMEGRWIQAAFIFSPAEVIFVIHARDLTENEKKSAREQR
jgi:uncharacterized DUF497 family protein